MNYSFLLSRSWQIIRKHHFLWWLGLLAMFTEGGGGGAHFNGSLPSNAFPGSQQQHHGSSPWSHSSPAPPLLPRLDHLARPRVAAGGPDLTGVENWLRSAWTRVQPFLPLVILGAVLLFLLWLILLYFSYAAQAGLILSVQALEEQQVALGFARALGLGRPFVWRLFGMGLLLAFGLLLLLAIFAAPVVALALVGHKLPAAIVGAVLLGVGVLLLFIVVAAYLSLLTRVAARRIVLAGAGVMDALAAAHELVLGRLGPVLVAWLLGIAVALGYGIAVTLALVIVGGVLTGIGFVVYLQAHTVGVIIYAVPVGAALLACLCVVGGAFTGYLSTYWTLVYRALLGQTSAPTDARPGPWDRPVGAGKAG